MDNDDRSEFKFLLLASQFDSLFSALAPFLKPDPHAGADGYYPVSSLYYDSPARDCYWDAWKGLPTRRKLRIRTYGTPGATSSQTSFLEVKYKADGRGAKRRVQTSLTNALQIADGAGTVDGFSGPDLQTVEEVHNLVKREFYQPACLVRYSRHAYALSLGHGPASMPLRVTFDHDLRAGLEGLNQPLDRCPTPHGLLPEGQRIMEVKCSGEMPVLLSEQLGRCGLQTRRFSKYCSALDLAGATGPAPAERAACKTGWEPGYRWLKPVL
jgi:hypothetical protein